ncbi:cation:proton antiporter [Halalkalicoccus tibetensis]|uniref:Cation:proton antiporter n=1 Tax=Halalkalicoccus tibetensis TaxID=175632 RepID=A0ABD5UZD7_9EURY
MSLGGIALATDFAAVIVTAAVLAILARKTKQPTIVAYILTGIVIGPVMLDLVGEDELIEIMAELGLGFLLFLLGIEMSFENIRDILKPTAAIAAGQAVLQAVLSFSVALLIGFDPFQSGMIALATTFGATPIIVKILGDKDELKTLYGRVDVGILIVQDIYLVIALAVLGVGTVDDVTEVALSMGRVLGLMALVGLAAYLSYRYLLPTLLRASAQNESTLFTVGIAWAFVFIFAAETLELSVEVGAFLAGLALAQLPYSTELKERMSLVTDFFIVVFFASIGLQMTADQLLAYWQEALIAAALLIIGNFFIVFGLFLSQNFDVETSFIGTINMLQVSEFSLVLGAIAVTQGFIEEDLLGFFSLMALVTMPLSTYVIINNHEIYRRAEPYLERFKSDDRIETELGVHEDHAVIIGYDRLVVESLDPIREQFDDIVLVDRSPENVSELRDSGFDYNYGDFRHGEIRQEADLENASFVMSMATQTEINRQLLEQAPEDATTFVAAGHPEDAATLYDEGADYVIIRQVLAGEVLAEHVTDYLTDREAFDATVDRTREGLEGGESDGR